MTRWPPLISAMLLSALTLGAIAQASARNEPAEPQPDTADGADESVSRFTITWSALLSGEFAVDLGEVVRGADQEFLISLHNDSEEPVTLPVIRSDCQCTEIRQWTKSIASGEIGRIEGVFRAPRRSGVTKRSELVLVGEAGPVASWASVARVVDPIRVDTEQEVDRVVFRLVARDGAKFVLTGFDPPSLIEVEESHGEESAMHPIVVTQKEWTQAGRPHRLVASSSHPRQSHVVLKIFFAKPSNSSLPSRLHAALDHCQRSQQ